MTLTTLTGPLIVTGQQASPIAGQPPADYNADAGPSGFAYGTMLVAPGMPAGKAVGWAQTNQITAINAAPAALGAANICALANLAAGVPMTLAAASTGITVLAADFAHPMTGRVVPAGCLVLDGNPALINYGTSSATGVLDPRTTISRCLSMTGVAGSGAVVMTVRGYDLYGVPVTQTITTNAGGAIATLLKGLKFVRSVTPATTDANNLSVGTTNVFEFPLQVIDFGQVEITWDAIDVTAVTGFTAAVVTDPSTALLGSVRGKYLIQGNAADGTRRLVVEIGVTPYAVANATGAASLFGIAQV